MINIPPDGVGRVLYGVGRVLLGSVREKGSGLCRVYDLRLRKHLARVCKDKTGLSTWLARD